MPPARSWSRRHISRASAWIKGFACGKSTGISTRCSQWRKCLREWRQPKAASSAPPQWRAPSAPCSLPESLGGVGEWGGVSVIRLDEAPCLPGKAQGSGLYIETIYPCPDACEPGAGYALAPDDCTVSTTDDGAMPVRWRAQWQQSLTSLEGCPPGTPWARLERIVLSHRSTGPAGRSNQLREQRLAGETGTRWTPGEVLVSDVVAWRLVMLSVYPDKEMTVLAEQPQFNARQRATARSPVPAALICRRACSGVITT